MRTIVTKFNKEEQELIVEMAEKSKLKDHTDIVEDIYGFMKDPQMIDPGEITDELIDDFVKGKFEYYIPMKKKIQGRIDFFERILTHPYYEKFKDMNAEDGASVLLEMLNAFYKEKKKEEGGGGNKEEKDEAMKEFEGIIKYGRELFDLLDDEWFQSMMQSQNLGGGSGSGKDDMPQQVKGIVEKMGKELLIYELSKKLEFTIRMSKKGKFNEVPYPDSGMDVDRIKKTRDITKLLPSQFAMDDELFLKKLLSKELLKKKFMQRQEKRQVLYMLVDSSGSMGEQVVSGLTKVDVCKAVAIALMKKMISNEDLFYFRWFTDKVDTLHIIETKEQAKKFLIDLVFGKGADGGTRIQLAIDTAATDIKKKLHKKMDLADILLVSDGDDNAVDVEHSNKMLEGIDMHTIMITQYKYDKKNTQHSNLVQMSKNLLMTVCNKGTDVVEIANIFSR